MFNLRIALSFDSNMFHQAKELIMSVKKYCIHPEYKINILAIDLSEEEIIWLKNNEVNCFDRINS